MTEGLTIPQSRFASQLRVAAKPSRPVLQSSKASGCWSAVVASSATGGAPLRAPYTGEPWCVQTGGFAHDFPIFTVGAAISRPSGCIV